MPLTILNNLKTSWLDNKFGKLFEKGEAQKQELTRSAQEGK